MNSNLIPEVRTDKNGVLSTRWVKPDQGNKDKVAGIPAPTGIRASAVPSQELLESAAALYVQEIESDMAGDDEYLESALETAVDDFSRYPASVVAEIAKETEHGFIKFWGLKRIMEDENTTDDADFIFDYLKLADLLAEEDYDEPEDAIGMAITLSKAYDGLQPIPFNGEYPELRLKQIKSLARGFIWVESQVIDGEISDENAIKEISIGSHHDLPIIADERLSSLLIERADESDVIVDFIKTRKSVDVDAILQVLDSEVPALSSGII